MPTATHPDRTRRAPRRGSTLLVTMIFLAVFTALAVSFTAATNMNLHQADGYRGVQNAQLAAESGLGYMVAVLGSLVVPNDNAEDDLLAAVATELAAYLEATGNVPTGGVTYDGAAIRTAAIPWISEGRSFSAELTVNGDGLIELTVRGRWRSAARDIRVVLEPDNTTSSVFDYGIASKGQIILGGDGSVLGANHPAEANVLSATYSNPTAVSITGNCTLDGSVSTSNPASVIEIKGKPTIGGTSDKSQIADHLHIGVGDPVFPEIDTSPFAPLATNVFDPAADTSSDLVLDNVRIPAGTNPTFSAGVTIRGVMLIEQPNQVKFAGHAQIIGTIVTEDPGDWSFYDNTLTFTGTVDSRGVESLPDEPQFAAVKQTPGTMLLAPGFGVTFTGNFQAINGAMAAEKFAFTGNAGGAVHGPIISYGDTEFELLGSSEVTIDRSTHDPTPIGFKLPVRLIPVERTYQEI